MYILGINISHHSSIALLKDGELVYFLEEERLNKVKHGVYKDPVTKQTYLTPINIGIYNLYVVYYTRTHLLLSYWSTTKRSGRSQPPLLVHVIYNYYTNNK